MVVHKHLPPALTTSSKIVFLWHKIFSLSCFLIEKSWSYIFAYASLCRPTKAKERKSRSLGVAHSRSECGRVKLLVLSEVTISDEKRNFIQWKAWSPKRKNVDKCEFLLVWVSSLVKPASLLKQVACALVSIYTCVLVRQNCSVNKLLKLQWWLLYTMWTRSERIMWT